MSVVVAEASVVSGSAEAGVGTNYQIPESLGDVELRSVTAIVTTAVGGQPRLTVIGRSGQVRGVVAIPGVSGAGVATRCTWSPDFGLSGLQVAGASVGEQIASSLRQLVRGDTVRVDSSSGAAGDTVTAMVVTYQAGEAAVDARR